MIRVRKNRKIKEAYTKGDTFEKYDKPFRVGDEKELHEALIDMLYNTDFEYGDYQYPNFAEILKHYQLRIVPTKVDPRYTASIAFDSPYINVGEGCINDPKTFYQLATVIRHELSHNLMMHEIRLANKIKDKIKSDRFNKSNILHTAFNWIMDFEISNEVYTKEDKEIMREFKVNGEALKCLVTEDFRKDWESLTLEQMYDKLNDELKRAHSTLIYRIAYGEGDDKDDEFTKAVVNPTLRCYMNTKGNSFIWEPIEEFMKKSKSFKKFAAHYKQLLKDIYEFCKDKDKGWLEVRLGEIARSEALNLVSIDTSRPELDLYTPEEKNIANNVLKYLLGKPGEKPGVIKVVRKDHSEEYKKMYNEIIKKFGKKGEYTEEEIQEILDKINPTGRDDRWV